MQARHYLVVALLLLSLVGCGPPPAEREVVLEVTADGYTTSTLEATQGEQLFIRFVNSDSVAHSLRVDLPSGSRTVSAEDGVDAVLAVPLREAGRFRFLCTVPGHTESGELIVAPAP